VNPKKRGSKKSASLLFFVNTTRQAVLFLHLGARWEWVVNAKPLPLYPGKESRYP
jgi:hypothetical protein